MGGPPVVVYLLAVGHTAARMRATTIVYFMLSAVVSLVPMVWRGLITRDIVIWAVTAIPALFIGSRVGTWAFHRARPVHHRMTALVTLTVLGVVLIGRACCSGLSSGRSWLRPRSEPVRVRLMRRAVRLLFQPPLFRSLAGLGRHPVLRRHRRLPQQVGHHLQRGGPVTLLRAVLLRGDHDLARQGQPPACQPLQPGADRRRKAARDPATGGVARRSPPC